MLTYDDIVVSIVQFIDRSRRVRLKPHPCVYEKHDTSIQGKRVSLKSL